jgi:hypothetical protein
MAYPTVQAPYGLKPVNLIGGQVFAGSTREFPIQYGYGTNIFYGDFVTIVRGLATRGAVTTATTSATSGIFLGCSYTNPTTKQKLFSQYWPAGTLAGDAVAIVADDPDTVFRAAVVTSQGGSTIGSANVALIGQNVDASNLAGSVNTGNSANGVVQKAATPATTASALRVLDVVDETSVSVSAVGSSSTTTITLTTALASTTAIGPGWNVAYIAPNGQLVQTGSFVASVSSTTSVTINQAILATNSVSEIPSGSTIVFTQFPEVLVKIDFGIHSYYSAAATA